LRAFPARPNKFPARLDKFPVLNPVGKTHWTNKLFVEKTDPVSRPQLTEPSRYAFAQLNPFDNAHNLSSEFLDSLDQFPERQRKRFVEGVFIDEVEDALWTYEQIESSRIAAAVPELARVVVAVDPSGAKSAEDLSSDEIGIVVAGTGRDGKAYILAARAAEVMQALKSRLTSATKLSIMKIAFRVISLPGAVSLALEAAAGANPEASARRDPEQMNGLVLLGAAGGLPRLLPVGDGD
jgi:hypothetical protein